VKVPCRPVGLSLVIRSFRCPISHCNISLFLLFTTRYESYDQLSHGRCVKPDQITLITSQSIMTSCNDLTEA